MYAAGLPVPKTGSPLPRLPRLEEKNPNKIYFHIENAPTPKRLNKIENYDTHYY
jgi:hypothetical protein